MKAKEKLEIVKETVQEILNISSCSDLLGPFSKLFSDSASGVNIADVMSESKNFIDECKSIPQRLFLGKMSAVLNEMNISWEERIELSKKLSEIIGADEKKQQQFLAWIDGIQDLRKIKYYANAFRCWLVCDMKLDLLYKIISLLDRLTSYELDYIASFDLDKTKPVDVWMSYLVCDNIFKQTDNSNCYQLTSLGQMLKQNCLNYDEGLNGRERVLAFENLQKAELMEAITEKELDEIFK